VVAADPLGVDDGLGPLRDECGDDLLRELVVGGVVLVEGVFDRALGGVAIHQIGPRGETDNVEQKPEFKARGRVRQLNDAGPGPKLRFHRITLDDCQRQNESGVFMAL
jgi:hypothetical protein